MCRGQALLHGFALVRDLAGDAAVGLPLIGRQAEEAAGRILVVALFGGLAGFHTLGDGVAVCLPGDCRCARVEVVDETHHGGLAFLELLRGGWEQIERGGRCRLTCGGWKMGSRCEVWSASMQRRACWAFLSNVSHCYEKPCPGARFESSDPDAMSPQTTCHLLLFLCSLAVAGLSGVFCPLSHVSPVCSSRAGAMAALPVVFYL